MCSEQADRLSDWVSDRASRVSDQISQTSDRISEKNTVPVRLTLA